MVPSPRVPRSAHYPHLTSWITSLKCGAKLGQVGLLSAVAFLGLLAGCTGGGSSPASPSQPSVTVTSSSTSVLLGATQQFTATVTGTSNTAVSWSVNNVAGGNATVGTIDTNGLY